jgi:hypothetical protein
MACTFVGVTRVTSEKTVLHSSAQSTCNPQKEILRLPFPSLYYALVMILSSVKTQPIPYIQYSCM